MTTKALPSLDGEGGLSRYFREIWAFPILKPEEEFMLATRLQEHGDVDAAHRLVTSHLRLVAKIAAGYRGYGLPMADLVSEGNIGLMKAVKKFEPQRGFRLATYAMWWIRAAITEYILKSWSLVRTGTLAAQKKLFFSLGRIKRALSIADEGGALQPDQASEVADALGVSVSDVLEMDQRLASRDMSLNTPISRDDGDLGEYQDRIVDGKPSPEAQIAAREEASWRSGLLRQAIDRLPAREKHIFEERHLKEQPKTLEELGAVYGISRERVRQLEARALDRVTKTVEQLAQAAA